MKKSCTLKYVLKGFVYWLKNKSKNELFSEDSSTVKNRSPFSWLSPFIALMVIALICVLIYAPLIQNIQPPALEKLIFIYIPATILGLWIGSKLKKFVLKFYRKIQYFCELGRLLEEGVLSPN